MVSLLGKSLVLIVTSIWWKMKLRSTGASEVRAARLNCVGALLRALERKEKYLGLKFLVLSTTDRVLGLASDRSAKELLIFPAFIYYYSHFGMS